MGAQTVFQSRTISEPAAHEGTFVRVLTAISFCHLLNDMIQSLVPSVYPILKASFGLNFTEIGLITLAYQTTASLLQPVIGNYTDRKPMPYSLPFGMLFTLFGLVLLGVAPTFMTLLAAAVLIGIGSAVFHPESSRVARMASGGKHGLAQSFFQVGGNAGSAIGPLLAALIVLPRGQVGVIWFSLAAMAAIPILGTVGRWYASRLEYLARSPQGLAERHSPVPRRTVFSALALLMALVFSKYFYLASFTSYYTFYLISRFHISVRNSQLHLFLFLAAVAAGTLVGGPVGDRIGRKTVIWCSILGVLPFSLMLPSADLLWTGVLSVVIGFVIASAFSAILVYAQELVPGRIGMISGLFFGLAFGMGGIGAAVLGRVADLTGIVQVYRLCSFLPAIGLLTALLPDLRRAAVDSPPD